MAWSPKSCESSLITSAPLRSRRLLVAVAAAALSVLTGCGRPTAAERSQSLQAALDHYAKLAQGMQSDSIAALFTADGVLTAEGQTPIVGPNAIGTFLHRFDNYKILSETLTVDSAAVDRDRGFQRGHYTQTVILPVGDTVTVGGRFTVDWVSRSGGAWQVRRMATAPPS